VRPAALSLALLCSLALGACGDPVAGSPISHSTLESLIVNPFPVYWVGGAFHGLSITEANHDPSGSYSLQYGNCLEGGQGTCVPPLRVITSADNSFLPGGALSDRRTLIRGVPALVTQAGTTISIPTGSVVVSIYATNRGLAHAAALAVVPINQPAAPFAPMQAPLPDTGYGSTPLPSQEPTPLRPLR
jgi:hypothetical protein